MKKALSVFLMLALVGSVFAAEPVADVNVAEFSGNASVQWGVDLDSGKTGFKNDYEVNLKLNLLNNGSKSTTGDGIWGELVIKTDSDNFLQWENGDSNLMVGDAAFPANKGMTSNLNVNAYVDTAKLHFGPAYVGITRGNTQTGELKMDAAIRSSDDDQAKWLSDVGPDKYSQGIVAGFEHEYFNVAVDLRSKAAEILNAYKVTLSDSTHTLENKEFTFISETEAEDFAKAVEDRTYPSLAGYDQAEVTKISNGVHDIQDQYTNQYAMAAEVEVTPIDNLSIKGGVSYEFQKNAKLGFSGSAGYKFNINDTFYVRPQVGYTGETWLIDGATVDSEMAMGVLFGWGDIGIDDNADVPFLDGDSAKKVSPGVGVVAYLPLQENGPLSARIMPSFFSGELVPNLTAALYSDIGIMSETAVNKDVAFGIAAAAKYAIPVGAVTITPNAGIRFANDSYLDNVSSSMKEKDDGIFASTGDRNPLEDDSALNLKAGVDVTGLISNTTLSVIYDSRNLLNTTTDGLKAGTLNFKVKISL